ncbi:hypothetical protein [Rosistilla oblonga]|uniref:hypothetical protein n=1 Tax=Rosistilla oblonga TaxID=2527990 RepID=UPI003A96C0D6
MTPPNRINLPTLCLRMGAFLCFAGWTWVHYYWEGPYGVLLWHDATFEFATRMGLTWEEFVGDGINDGFVQQWIAKLWWLYLACTLLTLTVRQKSWLQMVGLVLGSGLLVVLSYAAYVASQNQLPMFIEHGGQMLSPILLVMALALGVRHRATVITAIVAVILTFAGHGSYALGLWPTPGNFYAMTTLILGVEYPTAQTMLRIAGVLDFVVCIGICIPYLRRPAALYASIWGFLTAIARPVAGMSCGLNYWGADQYLHEAVLRAPHCLIPLYLFLLWRQPPSTDNLDKLESTDSEPMGNE